jgi:acetyl-CoA C-acetyltransferase
MTIRDKAYIVGAYEHPTRKAPDKSVAQIHAESAKGALADAGLSLSDIDGYYCAGDAPGLGMLNMADYMGLTNLRHVDSTETGGCSYLIHVSHAAQAIAAGKCKIALITLAGRPRSAGSSGMQPRSWGADIPDVPFEAPFGPVTVNSYAMVAARHMYEYGTTSEQLAWIKVAASHHAQHNPHAMLRDVVTVEDVVNSPLVSTPLHRLDCCVISDGGGAIIVAREEIARKLKRPLVKVRGSGADRVEALRVADIFRARVVDSTTESFIFEITGSLEKNDAFIELMRPLGLIEICRTGVAAVARGKNGI